MKKNITLLILLIANLCFAQKQLDAIQGTASGTNSYSVTINSITEQSIYNGQKILVKFTNGNTTASTLKVTVAGGTSYPVKDIETKSGTGISNGDITAGCQLLLSYNSTFNSWQIIGGTSGGASQWTTTGSDIYYNTGNVGINNSSPDAKLDVVSTSTVNPVASFSVNTSGSTNATGVNINAEGGTTTDALVVNSKSNVSGGINNSIVALATTANGGYNNALTSVAQNGDYNYGGKILAQGGVDAVGLSISASGASSNNNAIDITAGNFKYTPGSEGSGKVLTSDANGVASWQTPAAGGSASVTITDDNSTNATMYPTWVAANSGSQPVKVSSNKFAFNPSSATLIFQENTNTGWNLYTRPQVAAGLNFPVPTFRPNSNNTVLALDITPRGTPSDYAGQGLTWIDICDTDEMLDQVNGASTRLGTWSDHHEIGTRVFGTGTAKPLFFTLNNTTIATMNVGNTWTFNQNVNVVSGKTFSLTGSTANGVVYNNSSSALTTSANWTFAPSTGSTMQLTGNGDRYFQIYNSDAGGGALTRYIVSNGSTSVTMGMWGTGFTTNGLQFANRGNILSNATNGLLIGTNTSSDLYFCRGGTGSGNLIAFINASGLMAGTDNSFDLGATGATRFRNAYIGTSVISPLIIGGSGTTQSLTYKTTSGVGATGADHIFTVGNNGATEAMRILNSGSVGIGTSSPASKLDVEGGVSIGATYSGTTAAPTNGAIIEGDVAIGATSTTAKLQVTDANRSGGGAAISATVTNTVSVSTNSGVNSVVSTTGSSTNNYAFSGVASGATVNFGIVASAQNPASANYGGYFSAQGGTNNYALVAMNGKVGIGTDTPTELFQVSGTASVSITSDGKIIQNGLITYNKLVSVADDGTFDIPAGTTGWCEVIAGVSSTIDGAIAFRFTNDGAVVETRVADAIASATADTDTKLCAFDNGSNVRIKNRLGGTRDLLIKLTYR